MPDHTKRRLDEVDSAASSEKYVLDMLLIGARKLNYEPQERWRGTLTWQHLILKRTEGVGGLPASAR